MAELPDDVRRSARSAGRCSQDYCDADSVASCAYAAGLAASVPTPAREGDGLPGRDTEGGRALWRVEMFAEQYDHDLPDVLAWNRLNRDLRISDLRLALATLRAALAAASQGEGGLAGQPCYCTTVDDGIGGTISLPDVPCPAHDGQHVVGGAMADLYGSNDDPQQPRMPEVRDALEAVFAAGLAAPTGASQPHVYAITDGHGDTWAVYCVACSGAAGEWVFPCKTGDTGRVFRHPPQVLAPVSPPPAVQGGGGGCTFGACGQTPEWHEQFTAGHRFRPAGPGGGLDREALARYFAVRDLGPLHRGDCRVRRAVITEPCDCGGLEDFYRRIVAAADAALAPLLTGGGRA